MREDHSLWSETRTHLVAWEASDDKSLGSQLLVQALELSVLQDDITVSVEQLSRRGERLRVEGGRGKGEERESDSYLGGEATC